MNMNGALTCGIRPKITAVRYHLEPWPFGTLLNPERHDNVKNGLASRRVLMRHCFTPKTASESRYSSPSGDRIVGRDHPLLFLTEDGVEIHPARHAELVDQPPCSVRFMRSLRPRLRGI